MSDTDQGAIVDPGRSGARIEHSCAVGHSRDPRLNPAMAEKVAEARARWERRGTNKYVTRTIVALSFDEMLDALLDSCTSYTEIGIACGVSRERIRQLHRDHFRSILPYRPGTGHKRRRICTIARRGENTRSVPLDGKVLKFAEAATSHGLNVLPVVHTLGFAAVYASRMTVQINGLMVRVKRCETPALYSPRAKTKLFGFDFPSIGCEFTAFWCGSPNLCWFIIPNDEPSMAGRKYLYIPEHPDTYRHNIRTDWVWAYREAWHLLKGEK